MSHSYGQKTLPRKIHIHLYKAGALRYQTSISGKSIVEYDTAEFMTKHIVLSRKKVTYSARFHELFRFGRKRNIKIWGVCHGQLYK